MDRPIDAQELRVHRLRQLGLPVLTVLVLVFVGFAARAWVRPSLSSGKIRTAMVERGRVEASILCSGSVEPAMEQVIACPFDSRVQRVLEQPGATLQEGQVLLQLEDTDVRLAVGRLQDEIALKQNQRRELALALQSRLRRLEGEQEIKRERLAFLESKREQQQALHDLGLASIHELRQAELDARIASIELRQLGQSVHEEQESTAARIAGLDIETSLLQRDLQDQQERLAQATVRAGSRGVLTWITDEEGAAVRHGEVIARVADLRRFRVEATVSDLHANRIAVGMPARIEVSDQVLPGRVSNIPPAINQGVMTLQVELEEPDCPLLRQNLRVDVAVITETRTDTLRVKKGPFINGGGTQQVYRLLSDERAVRTAVRIGVAGVDYYEVLSGLDQGDRVIISSMADHLHLPEVSIR